MEKKNNQSDKQHAKLAAEEHATAVEQSAMAPAKVSAATPESTSPAVPEVSLVDSEPIKAAMEATVVPTAGAAVSAKKRSNRYTIITVIVVVLTLLVVLFQLERQDRVGTNVFGGMIAALEANTPVAIVNGERLMAEDLSAGVEQLEQAAAAQGLDLNDPAVRTEIDTQAREMLVNTTLLKQAAAAGGIIIEESAVTARIDELAASAGGLDLLLERLQEFGITQEQLTLDITEELTIRALLDEVVFAELDLAISEAEITFVYQGAVDANGAENIPPLEEVRDQIAAQLSQAAEQAALDTYLQTLRADADIELN